MTKLTLAQARIVIDAALNESGRQGFAPMAVAVLDAGGRLLALQRDERAAHGRADVAIAKAASCLAMGFGGRELAQRAKAAPAFYDALGGVLPDGMLPAVGGVLIMHDAAYLGAVGISGDTGDNDEICALAGLIAAGFVVQTG